MPSQAAAPPSRPLRRRLSSRCTTMWRGCGRPPRRAAATTVCRSAPAAAARAAARAMKSVPIAADFESTTATAAPSGGPPPRPPNGTRQRGRQMHTQHTVAAAGDQAACMPRTAPRASHRPCWPGGRECPTGTSSTPSRDRRRRSARAAAPPGCRGPPRSAGSRALESVTARRASRGHPGPEPRRRPRPGPSASGQRHSGGPRSSSGCRRDCRGRRTSPRRPRPEIDQRNVVRRPFRDRHHGAVAAVMGPPVGVGDVHARQMTPPRVCRVC